MNRQTTNSPNGDEWFTPVLLLQRVQEFYSNVEWLDPASCAEAQEYVKATRYFTKENDALNPNNHWSGYNIWLNPPYSQPLISRFTEKLIDTYGAGWTDNALCLTNASTDTRWFQNLAKSSDAILFFSGRLSFWHPNKKAGRNPTGQALFYIGKNKAGFAKHFGDMGFICGVC